MSWNLCVKPLDILLKGIVLDTIGFELEKNIKKYYRKIRGTEKADEREYLERPGKSYGIFSKKTENFSFGLSISIETNCNSTNSDAANS